MQRGACPVLDGSVEAAEICEIPGLRGDAPPQMQPEMLPEATRGVAPGSSRKDAIRHPSGAVLERRGTIVEPHGYAIAQVVGDS
mmetsp:Transcript_114382/g.286004  ORF Transcript_114382/g.286004 Transcript_114382/m.286004 type:complete len:84 (+) Transcript_114382:1707-1958(+)